MTPVDWKPHSERAKGEQEKSRGMEAPFLRQYGSRDSQSSRATPRVPAKFPHPFSLPSRGTQTMSRDSIFGRSQGWHFLEATKHSCKPHKLTDWTNENVANRQPQVEDQTLGHVTSQAGEGKEKETHLGSHQTWLF